AGVAFCFFFQAEDGIRDFHVTGVQTCALPIYPARGVHLDLGHRLRVRRGTRLPGVTVPTGGDEVARIVAATEGHRENVVDREDRSEERRVGKAWGRGGLAAVADTKDRGSRLSG